VKYRIGYKYQLAEEYTTETGIRLEKGIVTTFWSIDKTGLLTARVGYAWDGSSGARDTKSSMIASLVHDVGYNAMNAGLLSWSHKPTVDLEHYARCVNGGMSKFRAWIRLKAIRKYGGRRKTTAHTEVEI